MSTWRYALGLFLSITLGSAAVIGISMLIVAAFVPPRQKQTHTKSASY